MLYTFLNSLAANVPPRYVNLPQISRLYKDAIAYPLLLTTRSGNSCLFVSLFVLKGFTLGVTYMYTTLVM